MDKTKKYFIHLLSSFLNGEAPKPAEGINWEDLYELANIHSLTAIVTNEIMKLPNENKPDIQTFKKFKQQLGYVLISYNEKERIIGNLRDLFEKNEIPFIFVKGTHIRNLYPVKELRTSGDIDVYVNESDYAKAKKLLADKEDMKIDAENASICEFACGKEKIELHSTFDYDHEYFSNIFEHTRKVSDLEYELSLEEHLLFVIMHIAKHMRSYGAGVRMFMDVDVLVRSIDNFDCESFIKKCSDNKLGAFAKAVFSLCGFWFNTPVEKQIDFSIDSTFNNNFMNSIIDGGSFGYEQRRTGDYYVSQSVIDNQKVNTAAKLKAILKMFFPESETLKRKFAYCKKHPILLPIAWVHKTVVGAVGHRKNSIQTFKQIINADDSAKDYADIIKELEL